MKFYGLVIWRRTGRVPDLLQLVYLKDGAVIRYVPDEADLLALDPPMPGLGDLPAE